MTSKKSQIKFAKSECTGELIGFVSRDSKTRQLKGVREDSRYGKQICVLAEDLKGTIERPIKPLDSYLVDTPCLSFALWRICAIFRVEIYFRLMPHKSSYSVSVSLSKSSISNRISGCSWR